MRIAVRRLAYVALPLGLAATMLGQQAPVGYDDTPMQPNGKWHIHDLNRPQPTVVTPGEAAPKPLPGPSDAMTIVAARDDLSACQMMDGSPVTWSMKHGVLAT